MNYKKLIVPAAAAFALVFSAAATAKGGKSQKGSVPTRLVHAVNGEDLGLPQELPVDIRIGSRCVAKSVPFGTIAEGPLLRPGVHKIRITLDDSRRKRRACRGTLVMADTINVNLGDDLSLVAHQTDDGGIRITKFNNDPRDAGPGIGRATVRHTADAPAVDILVEGDRLITALSNANGAKLDVPSDTYTVEIAPAGGDPLNPPGEIPLTVTAGENIIVYAVGSLRTGSFDLLVDVLPLQ